LGVSVFGASVFASVDGTGLGAAAGFSAGCVAGLAGRVSFTAASGFSASALFSEKEEPPSVEAPAPISVRYVLLISLSTSDSVLLQINLFLPFLTVEID
jgi:hypothetical protein